MTTYKEVLAQLSGEMGIDLVPDLHDTCMLEMEDGLTVRIEPAREGDQLLIGILVGILEPGPGRAAVLQAALIANGREFPRFGTFAYSRQVNQLVLTRLLPLDRLTGGKVKKALFPLVEEGRVWQAALKGGPLPVEPIVTRKDEPPLH